MSFSFVGNKKKVTGEYTCRRQTRETIQSQLWFVDQNKMTKSAEAWKYMTHDKRNCTTASSVNKLSKYNIASELQEEKFKFHQHLFEASKQLEAADC